MELSCCRGVKRHVSIEYVYNHEHTVQNRQCYIKVLILISMALCMPRAVTARNFLHVVTLPELSANDKPFVLVKPDGPDQRQIASLGTTTET